MQTIYKLLTLAFFLSAAFSTMAQTPAPCGTDLGISPWLRDFQSRIHSVSRTEEVLYLPLQVHVVGTDDGNGYMSREGVLRALCTLNEDFVQADLQFFLAAPLNYIDNSAYYAHEYDLGYEMMDLNNVPNAINCFIVNDPAGNCGYFFPGVDGIALSRGCIAPNDHTWAHEIGHFLSLPHPFYGWEGEDHDYDQPAPAFWGGEAVEKLDGSNCQFAADGFCDTAPDYLNYRWACNVDSMSLVTQTDPDGETFISNGSLFMSYSRSGCKGTFSPDQIAAMRANVDEVRPNLIATPPVLEDLPIEPIEAFTIISPEAGTFPSGNAVTLSWEPVPNATHYVVQLNPFNFFSVVLNEFLVTGTSIEVTGLDSDRDYYWRILPYNNYYSCTDFTNAAEFTTGTLVNNEEVIVDEALQLFPNPVREDRVALRLSGADATTAQWQLTDGRGRRLRSGSFVIDAGSRETTIDIAGLAAGIYFVRLQLQDRQAVRKLVIQ